MWFYSDCFYCNCNCNCDRVRTIFIVLVLLRFSCGHSARSTIAILFTNRRLELTTFSRSIRSVRKVLKFRCRSQRSFGLRMLTKPSHKTSFNLQSNTFDKRNCSTILFISFNDKWRTEKPTIYVHGCNFDNRLLDKWTYLESYQIFEILRFFFRLRLILSASTQILSVTNALCFFINCSRFFPQSYTSIVDRWLALQMHFLHRRIVCFFELFCFFCQMMVLRLWSVGRFGLNPIPWMHIYLLTIRNIIIDACGRPSSLYSSCLSLILRFTTC